MIGFVEGKIRAKKQGSVILNVNGVGYVINCPADVARGLEQGADAEFFVETKVSENDITLYGFETEDDQELFNRLNKVQGVGGKSALAVLSALGFNGFCNAVVDKDERLVCRADGVGAKTATRIINDLASFAEENAQAVLPGGIDPARVRGVERAVVAALTQMGFKKDQADQTFKKVLDGHIENDDLAPGNVIGSCLRELGGQPAAS